MKSIKKAFKWFMKRLDGFFIWIADSLGTNACILLFCFIAFAPLLYQTPQTILELQSFVSQTVIQLIALAILAKVSKIESSKVMKLLKENHSMQMAEMKEDKEERIELLEIHRCLGEIYKDVHKGK
jgi:hypothetical protein